MDSSNAEKAVSLEYRMTPAEGIVFTAGRASRDAEVAELTRLLADSLARFADSEARRAELEAVIEKVRGLIHDRTFAETMSRDFAGNWWPQMVAMDDLRDALSESRPVVLEDRDREVAARALLDAAAVIPEEMRVDELAMNAVSYTWLLPRMPRVMLNGGVRFAERLVQRAAAIRKGDTNV